MHNLEYELRESKFRLRSTFNQDKDHWIIHNNEPEKVDILEDINSVYKIEAKDQIAPLKVSIVYNKDDTLCFTREKTPKKRYIKVQVHLTDELKPSRRPNMIFKNKMNFTIVPLLERAYKFETDIFLIFSSVFGCSVTVKAKFPDQNNQLSTRFKFQSAFDRKMNKEEFTQLLYSNHSNKYERLLKEIDTGAEVAQIFKKIKYKQMLKSGIIQKDGLSFLEKNKRACIITPEERRARLKIHKRAHSCVQKKNEIENQNHQQKLFLVNKWKFIRIKRKQLMKIKLELNVKKRVASHFLKIYLMRTFVNHIYQEYDSTRFKIHYKGLIMKSAVKIYMVCMRRLRRIKPKLGERTTLQIQDCIRFANNISKDSIYERAQKIIQSHLTMTSLSYNFTKKSIKFVRSAKIIQRAYISRYKIYVERIQEITNDWEDLIGNLIEAKTKQLSNAETSFLVKQRKNAKKIKRNKEMLESISTEFRDLVIKKYYELTLLSHKLKCREIENNLSQNYEECILKNDNESLIKEIMERKRKLFGKPEMTSLEIDFREDSSPNKLRIKPTASFGAITERFSTYGSIITKSGGATKLLPKNIEEIDKFSEDKSANICYPDFDFIPSERELMFLIEKAKDMKEIGDIDKYKAENRRHNFGARNMMRVEHRSTSSISHYS
ncbi:unnamed protein product [Moneuplotes crassus]|uniref:Uncharacterized protein n=1 Tax=Euplotes crassus TaxID=5936 RepID=A0AAD2D970_EUPCR|nr:unnamed protein product [Moneuplotes crassus]